MIAIIAEKPSVGQEIARVVGATEKKDGYITGNGYMVTWALGHLVSLALPGTYGYTRTTAEDLPMLPEPFRLVERQIRTDRGMVTDIAAGRQLKVIDGVFSECDSIIVATDAGREGELIFRWIYSHLGCTKPFKRLWFSSLTDSRNPSPESIQILIRTQEITMPDEDETEAEAAAEVQTTFWGRVAQMFKDFWAAITGLFGGKD